MHEYWEAEEFRRIRTWQGVDCDFDEYMKERSLSLVVDGECLLAGAMLERPLILDRFEMKANSTLVVAPYLDELVLVAQRARIFQGAVIDARVESNRVYDAVTLGQSRASDKSHMEGTFGGVKLCTFKTNQGFDIDLLGNPLPPAPYWPLGAVAPEHRIAAQNRFRQAVGVANALHGATNIPPKPPSENPRPQARLGEFARTGAAGKPGVTGKRGPSVFLGLGLVRFDGLVVETNGGTGGEGGDGTQGQGGANADCYNSGQNGARGGKGGAGGRGGNAGSLYLDWWEPSNTLSADPKDSTVFKSRGGENGEGGRGGEGGSGGRGEEHCPWSKGAGNNGDGGSHGRAGPDGSAGQAKIRKAQNEEPDFSQLPPDWAWATNPPKPGSRTVCSDSIPDGWLPVNYFYRPNRCGNPPQREPNSARITRIDILDPGTALWACIGNGPGLGSLHPQWAFKRWKWDPGCSETSAIGAAWLIERQP